VLSFEVFTNKHFFYYDAIPLGLGRCVQRYFSSKILPLWGKDWDFISMDIKTVKTVSRDWIMISFYPRLKPWLWAI
jgi:hypothetical protein